MDGMTSAPAPTRRDIYDRAHRLANEIAQIFADANHWNDAHPDEAVHPDPGGELRYTYTGLTKMLAAEPEPGARLVRPLIWEQP